MRVRAQRWLSVPVPSHMDELLMHLQFLMNEIRMNEKSVCSSSFMSS